MKIEDSLSNYLSLIKVPFLHPSDVKWPEMFKRLFPINVEGTVNLGKYSRTPNKSEIDGHFDLCYGGKQVQAVIECKNRAKALPTSELFQIIEKALQFGSVSKKVSVCILPSVYQLQTLKMVMFGLRKLKNY